jgi:broad specificity phosphatase PhoE
MLVTLFRHYKVDYRWKRNCFPRDYHEDQIGYDNADVVNQNETLSMEYQKVIISCLKRTRQTMDYLLKEPEYEMTDLLNEVPMEPFTNKEEKHTVDFMNVMARLQWMMNSKKQPETRRESIGRANEFIEKYLIENMNYLVIGHGCFFRVLSEQMRKHGFKGKRILYMRNGESVTYLRS